MQIASESRSNERRDGKRVRRKSGNVKHDGT